MAHDNKQRPLNTFHLFAGAGGGILADRLLGHNPIGACEIEEYPRNVLLARQRDGILPEFPLWDDVCTLDGKPWRGTVDVLCGGFPCQDISAAGKGAGISGERSGLWKEYARLIGEMQPKFVFAENSPLLRTRGLGVVLQDLASLGYNARWGIIGAGSVGAPHKRDRMWVLAYANSAGLQQGNEEMERGAAEQLYSSSIQPNHMAYAKELQRNGGNDHARVSAQTESVPKSGDDCGAKDLAYANVSRDGASKCNPNRDGSEVIQERKDESQLKPSRLRECSGLWWHTDPAEGDSQPRLDGMVDGLAHLMDINGTPFSRRVPRVDSGIENRVHRLKAIGNGQVPLCAALAFNILSEGLL